MTLDLYNKSQRQLDKLVYVLSPTADENITHEVSAYFLIESCLDKTCLRGLRLDKTQTSLLGQGLHRLEKYLNLEGFLEMSLKIKHAL